MTWTQPLCDRCWLKLYGERVPPRVNEPYRDDETCSNCGGTTRSGIYHRRDPATVPYPRNLA